MRGRRDPQATMLVCMITRTCRCNGVPDKVVWHNVGLLFTVAMRLLLFGLAGSSTSRRWYYLPSTLTHQTGQNRELSS